MAAPRLTRDERRAQTVERLLDAAAVVFARQGFHAASVDDVAEAAGFSKGAVYSNFDSKEDLFLAVLDRHNQVIIESLEAILHSGDTLAARLDALGRWYQQLAEAERDWSMLACEFALYAARNPRLQAELAERDRRSLAIIAGMVEGQARELGLELPAPPTVIAAAILAVGDGIAIRRLIDPAAVPAGLFRDALALLLGHPEA